jgi:uncharacterized protein (DUF2235 family)
MPKNIVIFSDGTGQAGGLKPDQNLSNIYKLYRACRPGPESAIDPAKQVAAYDAGLGTENDEGRIPFRPIQKFRKLWSGATGTGISRNIADCYEAILKHYEPGDRVFVFGFSRGAYTARCVGGVMALCGVPTHGADGNPLPRYGQALRKIVDEAVLQVYEHGSGSDKPAHKAERQEKARRFREKYGSANSKGESNVVPHFIGVFDTVASLGAPGPRRVLMLLGLSAFVAVMTAVAAGILSLMPWFGFATSYAVLAALIVVGMAGSYCKTHLKTIRDFPERGDFKWHIAAWRFRFYDNSLNPRVRYARHALAIDETRKDFARVPWAIPTDCPVRVNEPEWLRQVWFAGNHSDIGGSYAEDESRLSDISLQWMVEQATELEHPLKIDSARLNLFPDPAGMQHNEIESMRESYPSWWPEKLRYVWSHQHREIHVDAPLHPTVQQRLALPGALHYGLKSRYRPENLQKHSLLGTYYGQGTLPDAGHPEAI